ncbi:MAG: acyl-CoA synthetase [Burkholderiales bacterium]|nr:acyl-CoA synthetase [Burkholderiales bacterium]
MATDWTQQTERSNLLALRIITWVAQRLGRRVARWLLYPITWYFVLAVPKARRASVAYLRRVLGREPGWLDGFRHVFCFASTILDRFYLLNGRFDLFETRVVGQEAVHQAMAEGRGVVMVGAHLGSFEAVRATGHDVGDLTVSMVMYEDNAVKLNQILLAINPALQPNIIALGHVDSMLRVKHSLDRGELVGMLCDRTIGDESGRRVEMLGSPASFPIGPFRLAAMLKRPVMLIVGLYLGDKRYEIHFEQLADFSKPGGPSVEQTIDLYVSRLEYFCKRAPYNWFNFYDFWEEFGQHDAKRPSNP